MTEKKKRPIRTVPLVLDAVVICSGGMDSVTLAHWYASKGYRLHLLTFDYGQRHKKEIEYARRQADALLARHSVVDLAGLGELLHGSALTDTAVDVPNGHYAADNMKATVVPNRNAIMLSVAYAVAVAEQADLVAFGAHGGDHFIYPDCRPPFVVAFAEMQRRAVEGFGKENLKLAAPFLNMTKADIVRLGVELGVDYSLTWSCYNGNRYHCGKCGTCVERKEAFDLARVNDPTVYTLGGK